MTGDAITEDLNSRPSESDGSQSDAGVTLVDFSGAGRIDWPVDLMLHFDYRWDG